MRRAARTDANQPAIVAALRAVGASVQHLAAVGDGVPDLLVGWQRRLNLLMEVKDSAKAPSDRRLTPAQFLWHREWRGTVEVVTTVEEALNVLGLGRAAP